MRYDGQATTLIAIILMFSLGGVTAALAQDDAKLVLGRQVFIERSEPSCALCHTLKHADALGEIGPSLDDLQPEEDRVRAAVSGGIGIMPPFAESLSEQEIDAVANYVANASRHE